MKGEKLCSLPSPFSIDLLRAISEKLQTNNLHPIKKTSRKIGNKKKMRNSLAGPHSAMKGTLSQWLAIFLALSEGLTLVRKMRRSHPLPSASRQPCNLAGTPLFQFSKSPGSAVRALLHSRETWTLWRDRAVSSAPPFALLNSTYLDLERSTSQSAMSNSRQLWFWTSLHEGSPQFSAVCQVLCKTPVAYWWLVSCSEHPGWRILGCSFSKTADESLWTSILLQWWKQVSTCFI